MRTLPLLALLQVISTAICANAQNEHWQHLSTEDCGKAMCWQSRDFKAILHAAIQTGVKHFYI